MKLWWKKILPVTNQKESEKLRLRKLDIALNGRFYITNDFYLPIRVCMKDIKDTSVDRNVKWIHSYLDGEIIVDITENDFMFDRDKIGILTALKEEFNFIDSDGITRHGIMRFKLLVSEV